MASFSLDDQPAYNALSYCWGEKEATCKILLTQTPFCVRPNLFAYLQLMRTESNHKWTFIDAICINQDDIKEKPSQVSLMGEVYSSAQEVTAWMGEKVSHYDKEDLTMLRRICTGEIPLDNISGKRDEYNTGNWRFCCRMLINIFVAWEYWSRLWIVQELILARNLTVRSGEFRLRGELLLPVVELVYSVQNSTLAKDRATSQYMADGREPIAPPIRGTDRRVAVNRGRQRARCRASLVVIAGVIQ